LFILILAEKMFLPFPIILLIIFRLAIAPVNSTGKRQREKASFPQQFSSSQLPQPRHQDQQHSPHYSSNLLPIDQLQVHGLNQSPQYGFPINSIGAMPQNSSSSSKSQLQSHRTDQLLDNPPAFGEPHPSDLSNPLTESSRNIVSFSSSQLPLHQGMYQSQPTPQAMGSTHQIGKIIF
jgi:hypothetical protein